MSSLHLQSFHPSAGQGALAGGKPTSNSAWKAECTDTRKKQSFYAALALNLGFMNSTWHLFFFFLWVFGKICRMTYDLRCWFTHFTPSTSTIKYCKSLGICEAQQCAKEMQHPAALSDTVGAVERPKETMEKSLEDTRWGKHSIKTWV